ncbi:MAG: hypothetical protein RJA49_73 [Actinomycetota bacterium]
MMWSVRVAYTLEQCWHRVPGGTGVAALRIAAAMTGVELVGVAGCHRRPAPAPWTPPIPVTHLPIAAPWLYEGWLRFGWPKVERATGRVDVAHATTIIPCASDAPLVVTVHDLAFLHEPGHFTGHGVRVFNQSLDRIRRRAALVLCSSTATMDDCVRAGLDADRLRLVPLGVDVQPATAADVHDVRADYGLPDEYLLFVGTVEPRKNLRGLVAALEHLESPLPLVVVGADGWGDTGVHASTEVRFLGFVPAPRLAALYAGAAAFCYPSEREGYGLPVLEAMAQGTPVVTSRGTATEETAGGAAVLVDPFDAADIARGIDDALRRRAELSAAGAARARGRSWSESAALTVAAYAEVAR